ncbi:MAG: POTRA domain-containing protein [Myxococcota bacterium]
MARRCLQPAWLALCLALAPAQGLAQDGGPTVDGGAPVVGADAGPVALSMDVEAQNELWGARIEELVLDAPPNVDQDTARQLLGVRRGDRLDAATIRRAVRRLVLLAKLDDVRIFAVPLSEGEDSVRLIVQLIPSNVVREVRFEGVGNVPVSALRRDLPVSEGDSLDARKLEAVQQAIKIAMAQEGYPRAQVQTSSETLAEGAVALVIKVVPGRAQVIGRVELRGDTRYPESMLAEEAGMASGQIASRTRLETAAQQLLAWYREKGHYSARVEPEPLRPNGDVNARIPVVINIKAGPRWVVTFRGNHVLSSATLKSRLALPPDRPLDAELAARLEDRIRTAYHEVGYHHAKVRARSAPGTEKGTRRLLFLIKEGPLTELRSVKLQKAPSTSKPQVEGSSATREDKTAEAEADKGIPERTLIDEAVLAAAEDLPAPATINQPLDNADVDAILSSGDSEARDYPQDQDPRVQGTPEYPRAFFSLFDAEKVYDHERFQKGARAMEDLLRSQGYLQPRVQGPLASYALDGAYVDVQYKVSPGAQSKIRSLSFRGNEALPSSELLDVTRTGIGKLRVEPGQPLNLFAVEEARLALQKHYANHGFPDATVEDALEGEKDRRQVDLVYLVTEREHVTIKEVVYRGNNITRTIVLRQQMTIGKGDEFQLHELEESRRKLLNLGLFSSVSIFLPKEETGPQRTLVVEVRERGIWDGETSVGVSAEQGPRFALSSNIRNIFGLGVVHGFRLRINWPYPAYFLPFVIPEVRDVLLNRFNQTPDFYFLRPLRPDAYDAVSKYLNQVWGYYPGPHPYPILSPLLHTEAELGFTLGYPKVPFVPWEMGLRSELLFARANRLAYTLTKGGLIFSSDMRAPAFRYLRASTSPTAAVQVTQLNCWPSLKSVVGTESAPGRTCAADFSTDTRRLDNGVLGLGTLRLPVILDGRDDIFKPHAGYLATAAADLVLGGGVLFQGDATNPTPTAVRSTFVRLQGSIAGYLPLTRALTLALSLRGGSIFPLGPESGEGTLPHYVPLFERFYLGGTDSVRGFQQEGVLPSDDDTDPSRPRPAVSQGGNVFWNGRSELRFPIAGPLEGAVFADAGQLLLQWRNWDPSKFSAGVGFGARVNTPVGPLVVDVGYGVLDGSRGFQPEPRRLVLHPAIGYF